MSGYGQARKPLNCGKAKQSLVIKQFFNAEEAF